MQIRSEAFKRRDYRKFQVATYLAAPWNLTPSQARKKIVALLRRCNFAINVTPLNTTELEEEIGELPSLTYGKAVVSGMAWAKCHVINDSSNLENTYPIEFGKPVCFDMDSGKAVTGVNPKLPFDEVLIIGTAWKSFVPVSAEDYGRIPITLLKEENKDYPYIVYSAVDIPPYSIFIGSRLFPSGENPDEPPRFTAYADASTYYGSGIYLTNGPYLIKGAVDGVTANNRAKGIAVGEIALLRSVDSVGELNDIDNPGLTQEGQIARFSCNGLYDEPWKLKHDWARDGDFKVIVKNTGTESFIWVERIQPKTFGTVVITSDIGRISSGTGYVADYGIPSEEELEAFNVPARYIYNHTNCLAEPLQDVDSDPPSSYRIPYPVHRANLYEPWHITPNCNCCDETVVEGTTDEPTTEEPTTEEPTTEEETTPEGTTAEPTTSEPTTAEPTTEEPTTEEETTEEPTTEEPDPGNTVAEEPCSSGYCVFTCVDGEWDPAPDNHSCIGEGDCTCAPPEGACIDDSQAFQPCYSAAGPPANACTAWQCSWLCNGGSSWTLISAAYVCPGPSCSCPTPNISSFSGDLKFTNCNEV